MPSIINLRRKIKSVKNTKQITKAMQMVAASKMRRAQEAVASTREYAAAGQAILARLQRALGAEGEIVHPLLVDRPVQKIALLVIASDRGLAGAYNMNIVKHADEFIKNHPDQQIDLVTIGRKASEGLHRLGYTTLASFTEFPDKPNSVDMRPIAKLTLDQFVAGNYDQVVVVYTRFYSTLRLAAETKQILPAQAPEIAAEHDGSENSYLFEPTPTEVLEYIVPRMVEIQLLQTVLESIASEHSSRMLAMKNATDNASDLMGDLTLTYNSVRQANITREIAEISVGANV